MNLEEFLIYLHNGAFTSAKFLFTDCLSVADLKNLRLVCRNLDLVATSYPIVTRLFMSSHQADLEAFEGITKNKRLARHVQLIIWDHSVYNLLLLHQNLYLEYPRVEEAEKSDKHKQRITQARKMWARLAKQQQRILVNDSDLKAFSTALPSLTSLNNIRLTRLEFACQCCCGCMSPAQRQWFNIPKKLRKYLEEPHDEMCLMVHDKWFPCRIVYDHPELFYTVFPSLPTADIWSSVAFRGLKCLAANLETPLPNLRLLSLDAHPSDVFSGSSQEMAFLKTAIGSLDCFRLSAFRSGAQILTAPFRDLMSSARNLTSLCLHFAKGPWAPTISSPVRLLTKVPPASFPKLATLCIKGPDATLKDLTDLAQWCGEAAIGTLYLGCFHLSKDAWMDVLEAWKQEGSLKHLDTIYIHDVSDIHVARGRGRTLQILGSYSSADEDAVVDFLNGDGDYPLLEDMFF